MSTPLAPYYDMRPATVPYGQTWVHPYGTRQIHRSTGNGGAGFGNAVNCGYKIGRIDTVKNAGDYVPTKWDGWRLCPTCFTSEAKTEGTTR